MLGSSPQTGQPGSRRTVSVSQDIANASWTSSRPTRGSPTPRSSLIVSVTCTDPMAAQRTPRTPPSAHEGTAPGGGGSGKTQR